MHISRAGEAAELMAFGRRFLRNSSLQLLLRDPLLGAGLEHIKWQTAAIEHLIVKLAKIELWTQFFLCTFPEFTELELTDLIAERLPRHAI